ncbi:MAG: excinuclease ABC subunit UvrA [bacterium]
MGKDSIKITGAKEHNLKSINVEIPKEKLVVITGPSGSGKSSLALDTLYAEGKRRYVESLSSYARQFLGIAKKPNVEKIDGLCPAIAIEQKTVGYNPRSTVGTITEIYDYLRVLYARIGIPHCPECGQEISAQSPDSMTEMILQKFTNKLVTIVAPIAIQKKGEFAVQLKKIFEDGFYRFLIDGKNYRFENLKQIEELDLFKTYKHDIYVLIDNFKIEKEEAARLQEAIEKAFKLSGGLCGVLSDDIKKPILYSSLRVCLKCVRSFPELEPRFFSFNSPIGACPNCHGLGFIQEWPWEKSDPNYWKTKYPDHFGRYAKETKCEYCDGKRLREEALCVTVGNKNIYDATTLSIKETLHFFEDLYYNSDHDFKQVNSIRKNPSRHEIFRSAHNLTPQGERQSDCDLKNFKNKKTVRPEERDKTLDLERVSKGYSELLSSEHYKIAETLLREIISRLTFLNNVGLSYLTLSRTARTLSGGEGQRIRLATQIGSSLSGVLYILDEPSIGLHQRDNDRLIKTLKLLRDQGNTVLVVEHDMDTIRQADYLVDMGPAAGILGGQITAVGVPHVVAQNKNSLTGNYLSGEKKIEIPEHRRKPYNFLQIKNATANNLKNVDVDIPLGVFVAVSGVSGSGKSSLVMQTLAPTLQNYFSKGYAISPYLDELIGVNLLKNFVVVDQSPIGRTPRSNPATYLGIFDEIRALYASLPESKARGYAQGRFSFNVREGRCHKCDGDGIIKVSMHFLEDVEMVCKMCNGQRYDQQTLQIKFKNKNIADILDMTVYEAVDFFAAYPRIKKRLDLLCEVGLDYIKLGQSAKTFSGGEAQRIKLVNELAKRGKNTIYILDEPTTGLHSDDVKKLLQVLNKLVDRDNTVLIIEHNLDVLKSADYIIDIGPEGGDEGGFIICAGRPEKIAKNKDSHTGKYLKTVL